MAVLFRYEIKKLISRKLVWILSAVSFVFLLLGMKESLDLAASGFAQGMKDIYALYEGHAVTDAFQKEVQNDFTRYVAAHPNEFSAYEEQEGEKLLIIRKATGTMKEYHRLFSDITNQPLWNRSKNSPVDKE